MGAEQNASLSLSSAVCSESPHEKSTLLRVCLCNGAAMPFYEMSIVVS